MTKKTSIKLNYTRSKGEGVSIDFFLYTAKEEEELILDTKGAFLRLERLDLSQDVFQCSHEKSPEKFEEALTALFNWHKSKFPQLASAVPLDYEQHAKIIVEFVLMRLDIEKFLRNYLGTKIPNRSSDGEQNIWSRFDVLLDGVFPVYCTYMKAYFDWVYQDSRSNTELDFKGVPPVGRYIWLMKQRRGHRPGSSGKSSYTKEKSDLSRSRKNKGQSNQDDKERQELDKKVRSTVKSALSQFETDPDLKAFTLEPESSYVRRLQHQVVLDLGYVSSSVGEGSERAVQIRKT